jgi:hypothetical protein
MMMGYQLYEIERVKSVREQRVANAQRGELAATVSRAIRGMSRRTRALAGARPQLSPAESTCPGCSAQLRPAD